MTASTATARSTRAFASLDPRATLVVAVLTAVAVVIAQPLWLKAVIVAVVVVAWAGGRVSSRAFAVTLGSLVIFVVGTVVLNAVIAPPVGGGVMMVGPVEVSESGLRLGLARSLQLVGAVLAVALVVHATPPVVLAEAVEDLLRPLRRLGAPTHEAVMMFAIALRFLPVLTRSFARLQIAQLSRGGGAHRRGVVARVSAVPAIIVPLFVTTIVRAKEIAEAMESRGYRGAVGRTAIREHRVRARDVLLLVAGVALLAVAIVVR